MNKIITDKDEYLSVKDTKILLDIKVKYLTIDIIGDVVIEDISNNEDLKLKIKVSKNANVVYNKFNVLNDKNIDIELICEANSHVILNYSSLILGEVKGNIKTLFNGNNIFAAITYKAVTQKQGKVNLKSDISIKKNQENNEFLESLHILMINDSQNVLIPNLNIESDKVSANHETTMAGIDQNYLHYLQSKGINKESAISLIKEGFLISNLTLEEKQKIKIKEILINRR